jgi:hypothetical protein
MTRSTFPVRCMHARITFVLANLLVVDSDMIVSLGHAHNCSFYLGGRHIN